MRQPDSTHLNVPDAEHMRKLGCALGRALIAFPGGPLVIFLRGELGAGKTTLVGGVLYAIGFNGPARSPTYTLIEPYETASKRIFHLDLYRLADPHEVEALGLRDLLTQDAILLIEWPERGGNQLPQADLTLTIRYSQAGDSREVVFTPWGLTGDSLASTLRDRSS